MNKLSVLWHYWRAQQRFTRWKNRSELETWQNKQLVNHLQHVRRSSPFFKRYFGQACVSDWRELPVLGKTEMMENFEEWNTAGLKQEQAFALAREAEATRCFEPKLNGVTVGLSTGTSGSRGLFLASDHEKTEWAGVMLQRVLRGTLWQRHRIALFLRADSNLYQQVGSSRIEFRYFDLQQPIDHYWQALQNYQPTVLAAPPRVLEQLANQTWAGKLMRGPKIILSVADVFEPDLEERLNRAFGVKTGQIYQATEGFLAATCPHGHWHWNEDCLFVEKEWIDAEKTRYQPILTDFRRFTQPIIRYRLNDILVDDSVPVPCPCGSIFRRFERIEGRSDEVLKLPSAVGGGLVSFYPDFIRRALVLALPVGIDYAVKQKSLTVWEVSLSDLTFEHLVRKALTDLMADFAAQPPEFVFIPFLANSLASKRRRIVCESSANCRLE